MTTYHRFLWVGVKSPCSGKRQFPLLVVIVGDSPNWDLCRRGCSCLLPWRRPLWWGGGGAGASRWPLGFALHLAIQPLTLTRKYLVCIIETKINITMNNNQCWMFFFSCIGGRGSLGTRLQKWQMNNTWNFLVFSRASLISPSLSAWHYRRDFHEASRIINGNYFTYIHGSIFTICAHLLWFWRLVANWSRKVNLRGKKDII